MAQTPVIRGRDLDSGTRNFLQARHESQSLFGEIWESRRLTRVLFHAGGR